MNDMPDINAETRQRVLDVARELGYRPSRFGRGLVTTGQQTIGLLVDNLTNPYYGELAAAVVADAAGVNMSVLLLDTSRVEDEHAFLTALAPQVDALVGYVKIDRRELDLLLPGVPVVRIDVPSRAGGPHWGGVRFDLEPGVREAVDHLHAHGVRRPLMLDSDPLENPSDRARMMIDTWAARGVEMSVVSAGGQDARSGEEATAGRLEAVRGADAIMAFNDYLAFGAMKTLRKNGIRVPEDTRVIGIDGLAAGTYTSPELTTLGVDMRAVARFAVSTARHLLDQDGSPGRRWTKVGYRLIVRESA